MKKPVPEDFDLTTEEYEKAIKEGFPRWIDTPLESVSEGTGFIVFISSIGLAAVVGLIGEWLFTNVFGKEGGIGFVLIGCLSGFLIYVPWRICLEQKKSKERDERYRRAEELSRPLHEKVRNYENALRDYQRRREGYWKSLRGREFEIALSNLYSEMGYNVSTTKASGDDGVDLFLLKIEQAFV